jgi:hypothetical protein
VYRLRYADVDPDLPSPREVVVVIVVVIEQNGNTVLGP